MVGEASSSTHSYFSGSNALSHVFIQYPPLKCHVPGSRRVFYDDGNKLILSLTPNQVFSWKVATYNPYAASSSDPISEGPVLSIRYSLDLKLLAIQRSIHEIQIWNKETGDILSQKCKSESESILGFFWTDCPTCDIVFVKTRAVLLPEAEEVVVVLVGTVEVKEEVPEVDMLRMEGTAAEVVTVEEVELDRLEELDPAVMVMVEVQEVVQEELMAELMEVAKEVDLVVAVDMPGGQEREDMVVVKVLVEAVVMLVVQEVAGTAVVEVLEEVMPALAVHMQVDMEQVPAAAKAEVTVAMHLKN